MRRSLASVLLAAATLGAAPLAAQSVGYDPSTPYSATALTGFLTTFSQLNNMQVDWTDATGAHTGYWGDLGGGLWGVTGGQFALTANGSNQAYFGLWSLHDIGLTSMTLYASTANAVFDVSGFPTIGTPGSSYGNAYNYCSINLGFFCLANTQDQWNTVATYSNPVGIGATPPVGDLWATLTVGFGTPFGVNGTICGTRGNRYDCNDVSFAQDVDQVALYDNLGTPQSVTPEPATMSLVATGLVGLLGAGVRRRKRTPA